ncbi:MAG: hypothetical protein DRG36_05670 [Deltaproteobacteria bacterium]|nr:MAG: hypothetical protein DRG36_05670 [Deltaproteobacteria bacterium]
MQKGLKRAIIVEMKKVTVVENKFEADLIADALSREGIRHLVRSYEDTAYDGIFVLQKGWGAILVAEEDEGRALEIIRELRRSWEKK